MKILTEYTWNYLKKNRKNTISILIAITIGTILLSTMVTNGTSLLNSRLY